MMHFSSFVKVGSPADDDCHSSIMTGADSISYSFTYSIKSVRRRRRRDHSHRLPYPFPH